jgi:hypothetical protein
MERTFKKMVSRYLNSQRADVIKRLNKVSKRSDRDGYTDDEIEQILFDKDQWDSNYAKKITPLYSDIADDAISNLSKELDGLKFIKDADEIVISIIEKRLPKAVKINETTRNELREVLLKASKDNLTVEDTARAINDYFGINGEIGNARALKIARTETASASNTARFEVMKAEGIEKHEWICQLLPSSRASHVDLDGEIQSIGDPFSNGLVAPGDPSGAPEEVIECLCIAVAVQSESGDGQ